MLVSVCHVPLFNQSQLAQARGASACLYLVLLMLLGLVIYAYVTYDVDDIDTPAF